MLQCIIAITLAAFAVGQDACGSDHVSTHDFGCVGVEDLDPLARAVVAAVRETEAAHETVCNGTHEYLSNRLPLDRLELNLYLPCDSYQTLTDVDTSRDDNIAPQLDGVTEAECHNACSEHPDCNVAVHKGASCWLKAIGVAADTVEYRPGFNTLYACEDAQVLKELIDIKLSMNELAGCEGHQTLKDATIVDAATLGPVVPGISAEACWQACAEYQPEAGDMLCEAAVFANSQCILKAASVYDPSTVYSPGTHVLYACK
jgi:hypothetical protein